MGRIYYLDLMTLIETLGSVSATLHAKLPKGPPGMKGETTGYVRIQNGTIAECLITAKNGQVMSGDQALQHLRTISEWFVKLEAQGGGQMRQFSMPNNAAGQPAPPLESLQRAMPASFSEYIPQALMPLHPTLLEQVGARERVVLRMVYMMINGQRSLTQIKEQLRLPSQAIDRAIEELRRMHIIE